MHNNVISPTDLYERKRAKVLDTEIAYIDTGKGAPIVFLHGNPTSSFLWRNVIPHVDPLGRCLAPDLVGMGESDKSHKGSYRFIDHARYLDAWLEELGITKNVTLVGHDWGSALGFYWAYRHQNWVRGIAYMEAIVRPFIWKEWPEASKAFFQALRSPAGEEIILQKNVFVEKMLPGTVLRRLSDEEMAVYKRPYLSTGESRRPTLIWPRELPINGQPVDVVKIVNQYAQWLTTSDLPKLFINADPGGMLVGTQREFCRSWPNQQEVTVKGIHFIQEDSPLEIGKAIATFISRI
jgi:haloalkane dehalogenase